MKKLNFDFFSFLLENLSAAGYKLSETGLGIENGQRQPEYWSNLELQSTDNPAVAIPSLNRYIKFGDL